MYRSEHLRRFGQKRASARLPKARYVWLFPDDYEGRWYPDRRRDRQNRSLRGSVLASLSKNVCASPLMIPSFALKHFEHGNVLGRQRITLDLLQDHSFKAPL